ncbi:MAG: hypothetical protein ACXABG_14460, partial [Promethearchaeota archaeon]
MKVSGKYLRNVPLINAVLITILFMVFLSISHLFTNFLEQFNLEFSLFLLLHFIFRFSTQFILIFLIAAFLFDFVANNRLSNEFFSFMRLSKGKSNKKAIIGGFLAFLGFWLPSTIIALVLGMYNSDINLLIGNPDQNTGNLGWFIFILAIIPGLWEEL